MPQSANRPKQAKRRAPRTAWRPGQSGNPRGRPKLDRHVRDLARRYTEEAIEALANIMRDESESATARTRAAEVILDRGWGRPAPYEEAPSPGPKTPGDEMSEQEVDARIQQLLEVYEPLVAVT